jgi:protein-S-isoprenylcysteine O-methyltransferase Ste14
MADLAHRALIPSLWLTWLAYWIVAARGVKSVRRSESVRSRASHLVPLVAGGALLAWQHATPGLLAARFVAPGQVPYFTGAAVLAAGLAFASWARHHLGANWSGTVTLKQDHELIRTGPYAIVRHPIYTGLLAAVLGTAIALGEWRGLVALALFAVALLRKMSIEEEFMSESFPEQYAQYRAEVPALIPLIY